MGAEWDEDGKMREMRRQNDDFCTGGLPTRNHPPIVALHRTQGGDEIGDDDGDNNSVPVRMYKKCSIQTSEFAISTVNTDLQHTENSASQASSASLWHAKFLCNLCSHPHIPPGGLSSATRYHPQHDQVLSIRAITALAAWVTAFCCQDRPQSHGNDPRSRSAGWHENMLRRH